MDVIRPFEAETLEAVKHHFCCILLVNGECYLKFNRKWDERWEDTKLVAKVGSQETPGVTGKFGLGIRNEAGQRLIEFCPKKCTDHNKHPLPTTQEKTLQCERPGFNPWVGKILWRRKWQPTPVLLP